MRLYKYQFFTDKEQAKQFKKEKGYGTVCSKDKYSKTKQDYEFICINANKDDEFITKYPYAVYWWTEV